MQHAWRGKPCVWGFCAKVAWDFSYPVSLQQISCHLAELGRVSVRGDLFVKEWLWRLTHGDSLPFLVVSSMFNTVQWLSAPEKYPDSSWFSLPYHLIAAMWQASWTGRRATWCWQQNDRHTMQVWLETIKHGLLQFPHFWMIFPSKPPFF